MNVLAAVCNVFAYLIVLGVSMGLFLRSWQRWSEGYPDDGRDFYAALFFAFIAFGRALAWALS